jgi:hypothetical protein
MKTSNKKVLTTARTQTGKSSKKESQEPMNFGSLILFIIKIGLQTVTTPEILLAKLRMHILKLSGNGNFPTTKPDMASLQALEADLEKAIDAVANGNIAQIPVRDAIARNAKEAIRRLAVNIEDQADSDPLKIVTAGFEVRKAASVNGLPEQVLQLKAKPAGPGKISLRWKKVDTALVYVIEQSSDPVNGKWDLFTKATKASITIENLNPGQLYYFRVFAINNKGDGNPSDPAEQRSL